MLGRLLQHIAQAVIHQQAAIGDHRERMQYPHRSNLANSSSGRSTSIVTSHVTNLPRQKKSAHRHRHLLRHRHLHRHRHLLRHRYLDCRRAGVSVTRSTCETHAPLSRGIIGVEDARYISICTLRKARRNPILFYPRHTKLGDHLHTRELIARLHHPLLLCGRRH